MFMLQPFQIQPFSQILTFSLLRSFVSNAVKALLVLFANMFSPRQMTCPPQYVKQCFPITGLWTIYGPQNISILSATKKISEHKHS
jgi:hypothetical protein